MISLPVAMHIPDGFLSAPVALACFALALSALAVALRVAGRDLDEDRVPLLGVVAAFIFAVQMLNFPIAGGTSGHLLGATLAAVLLGPWLACIVMAVVLGVQGLAFADGGLAAYGANLLNMGVVGALLAGLVLAGVIRSTRPGAPVFLGMVGCFAWSAVMLAAAATSFELAISGTVPLNTVLPAMLGVHALIGIGEAVITVAAISAVLAVRPDLLWIGDYGSVPREPAAGSAAAFGGAP